MSNDNDPPLVDALGPLVDRLLTLATEDEQLRSRLRRFARAILTATELPEEAASEPVSPTPERLEKQPAPVAAHDESPRPNVAALVSDLTLGGGGPAAEAEHETRRAWSVPTETDFSLIESRCRLKAEGTRWAATRRRRMAEGADFETDIEPRDRDVISRAKALPDCFLWMNHPSGPTPSNPKLYEQVAGCFDVLADVVSVIRQVQDEPDLFQGEFEQALDLLAEAQSALRIAVVQIDGPVDSDQRQVFDWLKRTTSERGIFIHRHMRANDPADPADWEQRAARVEALDVEMQEGRRRFKQRRKLLGKVRHKASLITAEDDTQAHWRILVDTVDELVEDGLPPSSRELRECLAPIVEEMPEALEVPRTFQLVLREIDRAMAASPSRERATDTKPAPEVREVRRLLEGRSMVLIGGDRRPGADQALQDAFGLSDLYWIETSAHESVSTFEPYVAREDVAVVVLAIRWSSHSYGDVKEFCDKYGKPLVRLPGGYNPNQVAKQITEQCSDRLAQV